MASTREVLAEPLNQIGARHGVLVVDTDTGSIKRPDGFDYVNVGIAECAAVGVSAGAAASGRRVVLCAFSAFAAGRAYEFIKLDIAYPNRPVCIAATHGGASGGWLGPTHHALEDTIVMGSLPNMVVLVPADLDQAADLLDQALSHDGPTYLRLGRKDSPALPTDLPRARLGLPIQVRAGAELTLVVSGPELVAAAVEAADALAEAIDVQIVLVHSIAPDFAEALAGLIPDSSSRVLSVEESWPGGPLERLSRLAVGDRPGTTVEAMQVSGFQEPSTHADILAANNLDAEGIVQRIRQMHSTNEGA